MKLLPFERKWRFVRPLESLALAVLSVALLSVPVNPAAAQHSDAHSDGNAARYDMMFGTPSRYGTAAPDNVFATTPGLEQQARRSQFTVNVPGADLLQFQRRPRAGRRPGRHEFGGVQPDPGRVVVDAGVRPAAALHSQRPRRGRPLHPGMAAIGAPANFDKVALSGRLQYIDPTNDQTFSPYFVYAPRFDFDPFFQQRFATRQDLNLGVNKTFNFDAQLPPGAVLAQHAGRHGLVARRDELRPAALPRSRTLVVGLLPDPVGDLRHLPSSGTSASAPS